MTQLVLRILFRTQNITPYIAAKFIVFGGTDEKYGDCTEDCWLADGDILRHQKHITHDDLFEAHWFVAQEEENEHEERELMSKQDKYSYN